MSLSSLLLLLSSLSTGGVVRVWGGEYPASARPSSDVGGLRSKRMVPGREGVGGGRGRGGESGGGGRIQNATPGSTSDLKGENCSSAANDTMQTYDNKRNPSNDSHK
jgi:hypothetical protein